MYRYNNQKEKNFVSSVSNKIIQELTNQQVGEYYARVNKGRKLVRQTSTDDFDVRETDTSTINHSTNNFDTQHIIPKEGYSIFNYSTSYAPTLQNVDNRPKASQSNGIPHKNGNKVKYGNNKQTKSTNRNKQQASSNDRSKSIRHESKTGRHNRVSNKKR